MTVPVYLLSYLRRLSQLSLVAITMFGTFAMPGLTNLFVASCGTVHAAEVDDDEEDEDGLPPAGLIATYKSSGTAEANFSRLEPTPAVLLTESQSPDPRLQPGKWAVRWSGQLQVLQPGTYRFSAILDGTLTVRLDDKVVLEGSSEDIEEVSGSEIELPFGLHPIQLEYQPSPTQARLRLMWESDQFAEEPVPATAFSHQPTQWSESDEGGWLSSFAQGQLMVEEHACIACHSASDEVPLSRSLSRREGPRLHQGSQRLKAAWIYAWLADPQVFRTEAVMPRLFPSDANGDAERYALAVYLSQSTPSGSDAQNAITSEKVAAGQKLFERIGCTVCHDKQGDLATRATLAKLGQKTTPEQLARFLQDPLAVDPSGRMPHMFLSEDESDSLAQYLIDRDASESGSLELPAAPSVENVRAAYMAMGKTDAEAKSFDAMPTNEQLESLAVASLQFRRCINCHEVRDPSGEVQGNPRMAEHNLSDVAQAASQPVQPKGCLSETVELDRGVPRFAADVRDNKLLRDFLSELAVAVGSIAPGHDASLTMARFQCMRCHDYNAQGGLSPEFAAKMLAEQTEAAAELIHPPTLTGVVHKLLAKQLRGTLVEGSRARPWMDLRMPGFPKPAMEAMPSRLAALEGDELIEANPTVEANDELIEAGQTLIGSQGFGCTKCHDLAGKTGSGTRGPDLANVPSRVGFDWYLHWMTDPQRMQPGTRMPTVFFQGQSPYPDVLGGDPQRQRDAMWQYLLVAAERPLADSMPEDAVAEALSAGTMPQVMRTFLPDVSPRSMAIRYPQEINLAYDAQSCRLAYAWQGEFLDLQPVWTERGGRPARIEGEIFWRAPAGFPWDVTYAVDELPNFTNRGDDTAFGAVLPDDKKLHPTRLDFLGYRLSPQGPQFEYVLYDRVPNALGTGVVDGRKELAHFAENAQPFITPALRGVVRRVALDADAGSIIWFHAADSETLPTVYRKGNDPQAMQADEPLDAASVVCEATQNGAPLLITASEPAAGSQWVAVKSDSGYQLLLAIPAMDQSVRTEIRIAVPTQTSPEAIQKAVAEITQNNLPTVEASE